MSTKQSICFSPVMAAALPRAAEGREPEQIASHRARNPSARLSSAFRFNGIRKLTNSKSCNYDNSSQWLVKFGASLEPYSRHCQQNLFVLVVPAVDIDAPLW